MFDLRSTPVVASPSIVPDETLDRAHLFRMTLGDHSLEGEVLRLFDRQCGMLIARMAGAELNCIRALAHTIDGSARGVGAWRVSNAARALMQTVNDGTDPKPGIAALQAAIAETLVIVADLLKVH